MMSGCGAGAGVAGGVCCATTIGGGAVIVGAGGPLCGGVTGALGCITIGVCANDDMVTGCGVKCVGMKTFAGVDMVMPSGGAIIATGWPGTAT